jgi:hypothetical protein
MNFKYLGFLLSVATAISATASNYIVMYDPNAPDSVIDQAIDTIIANVSPFLPISLHFKCSDGLAREEK